LPVFISTNRVAIVMPSVAAKVAIVAGYDSMPRPDLPYWPVDTRIYLTADGMGAWPDRVCAKPIRP